MPSLSPRWAVDRENVRQAIQQEFETLTLVTIPIGERGLLSPTSTPQASWLLADTGPSGLIVDDPPIRFDHACGAPGARKRKVRTERPGIAARSDTYRAARDD